MESTSSSEDESVRDTNQVKAGTELRQLKPASQRPNDVQLVAKLTTGNVSITDQVSVCAQLGFSTTAKDHGHVGGLLAGKIGSNKFVADYAVDSRAKCRDTKCNAYILQSDLRIGKIPPSIKTGHSCRTHWYHLPCIFRSFRRACKGTKTITSVEDIANFENLRPSDKEHIRVCIQCAKSSRDRRSVPPAGLSYYKRLENVVSEECLSPRSGGDSPTHNSPVATDARVPGKAYRKRKGFPSDKPPTEKKGKIAEMSVSEHEVAGILGLTMLSHPEDGENGAKEKTADVSNDKKNGDEANTEKTVNEMPPTTTTQPASVVEDAKIVEEQEASASSECEPRNPTTSSSSSLMSDLDAVFDATNKTDPSSKAMEEDESEKLRTENPQENSVSREFRNTENAGASPGWLEPGTKCEFLYRDQWHVGVIDSYTSQKALVKFGSHDSPVPVDLLAEKHRVCWKLGTYTSKSHFA